MAGVRPSREMSTRMGVVPYSGDSNRGNNGSTRASAPPVDSRDFASTTSKSGAKPAAADGYSDFGSAKKSGNTPQSWPSTQEGVPVNSNSWQSYQGQGGGGGAFIRGAQSGAQSGDGAVPQQQQQPNWQQGSNHFRADQQQQQQPDWQQGNFNSRNVQQGIPAGFNNSQYNGPQTGQGFYQGPQQPMNGGQQPQPNPQGPQGGSLVQRQGNNGNMPKGDYVYYDGNGNQIQPGGGGGGSGSEKHFHHHYYHHNSNNNQPQSNQRLAGYPYDKKLEERKKRGPVKAAIAAALITCYACTCCCHAPCGW